MCSKIEVAADRYWGAQTQRSLHHFHVGDDHFTRGLPFSLSLSLSSSFFFLLLLLLQGKDYLTVLPFPFGFDCCCQR